MMSYRLLLALLTTFLASASRPDKCDIALAHVLHQSRGLEIQAIYDRSVWYFVGLDRECLRDLFSRMAYVACHYQNDLDLLRLCFDLRAMILSNNTLKDYVTPEGFPTHTQWPIGSILTVNSAGQIVPMLESGLDNIRQALGFMLESVKAEQAEQAEQADRTPAKRRRPDTKDKATQTSPPPTATVDLDALFNGPLFF